MAAREDALHGAVVNGGVRECSLAGGLQARAAVEVGKSQHVLRGTQSLNDAVREQLLDERDAVRSNAACLIKAPQPIVGEERPSIGWQVIEVRTPLAGSMTAKVSGNEPIVLKDRHRHITRAQPQCLPNQGEGGGVEAQVELDVTVTVQNEAVPGTELRRGGRELAHQGLLDREALERLLARGAVDAYACLLDYPAACLLVQICEIAKAAGGEEVALDVLDARLDDPLLG